MNFSLFLLVFCSLLVDFSAASSSEKESRVLRSQFFFGPTPYHKWIDDDHKPVRKPNKDEIFARMRHQINVQAISIEEGDAIVSILVQYPRRIPAHLADLIREALRRPAPGHALDSDINKYPFLLSGTDIPNYAGTGIPDYAAPGTIIPEISDAVAA